MLSELERLEQKTGRVHTAYDFQQAREKAAARPGELDAEDMAVLRFFGGDTAADRATAARDTARGVTQPVDKSLNDLPVGSHDLSRAAALPKMREGETIEDFFTRTEDIPARMGVVGILWGCLSKLLDFTKAINEKNKERNASIAALEARIAALEAHPAALPYKGVWKSETAYTAGHLATFDGSLWHANELTYTRPGTDRTWTLCVKHGRDAR